MLTKSVRQRDSADDYPASDNSSHQLHGGPHNGVCDCERAKLSQPSTTNSVGHSIRGGSISCDNRSDRSDRNNNYVRSKSSLSAAHSTCTADNCNAVHAPTPSPTPPPASSQASPSTKSLGKGFINDFRSKLQFSSGSNKQNSSRASVASAQSAVGTSVCSLSSSSTCPASATAAALTTANLIQVNAGTQVCDVHHHHHQHSHHGNIVKPDNVVDAAVAGGPSNVPLVQQNYSHLQSHQLQQIQQQQLQQYQQTQQLQLHQIQVQQHQQPQQLQQQQQHHHHHHHSLLKMPLGKSKESKEKGESTFDREYLFACFFVWLLISGLCRLCAIFSFNNLKLYLNLYRLMGSVWVLRRLWVFIKLLFLKFNKVIFASGFYCAIQTPSVYRH